MNMGAEFQLVPVARQACVKQLDIPDCATEP